MREAVQPGGLLARAFFDAWDEGRKDDEGNSILTAAQMEKGLKELIKENPNLDCGVAAVTKKIVRELSKSENDTITMPEFLRRVTEVQVDLETQEIVEPPLDLL